MPSNTNPFDDESGTFHIIENVEGQCSLWPDSIEFPAGWQQVFGPGRRSDCLAFVSEYWIDIAPRGTR